MEHGARLAMPENALARGKRKQCAAAHRFGRRWVPLVSVIEIGLDKRRAGIGRRGVRQQRPDLRPCTVRADEKVGGDARPVSECQFVPAGAKRHGTGELLPPLDGLRRQGPDENAPEIAAQHFGTPAGTVIRLRKQHRAVLVEHARRLAAFVNDGAECVGEAGRRKRKLSAVRVDIELSALRAGLGRGLGFVDRRRYAVDVEDAGEG